MRDRKYRVSKKVRDRAREIGKFSEEEIRSGIFEGAVRFDEKGPRVEIRQLLFFHKFPVKSFTSANWVSRLYYRWLSFKIPFIRRRSMNA